MSVDDELDKIRDKAVEASGDLLDDIRRLEDLAAARRPDPDREREYEALRDSVTKRLVESGPRYYLDSNGVKRFAYAVQPEEVECDVEEIVELHGQGKLPLLDVEKVFPRKVDKEQLRRALSKKQLPRDVVVKHIRLKKRTGHTRWADPRDDA